MAKIKKTKKGLEISGTAEGIIDLLDDAANQVKKEVAIRAASLKDDFCNFSYELKTGVTIGDELSRNGASVVHQDLKEKFERLAVHIAYVDGSYTLAQQEIGDIDNHHEDEIARMYSAIGFKLTGSGDMEAVELIGTKQLRFGTLHVKMPKVHLTGSYQFVNELRVAIDDCIAEVEAYMHGKTAPKLVQKEMDFNDNEGKDDEDNEDN